MYVHRRNAVRAIVVAASAAPVLLWAPPAFAALPGWRRSGLTFLEVLGFYVGLPLALFIGISLLFVLIPFWVGESRRSQKSSWGAQPLWFDGPRDGQQSVDVAEPSQDGGGASARW